ncbi:hypothetical protein [Pelomonas sp. KK5]|uniref:hypothetical protein n=1 Tax=Pelomonas sp. KK5 TaxID=1855730 RepID=UPI00097CB94A|nr:hypothetical protein [Pelomonas sp. KK5]
MVTKKSWAALLMLLGLMACSPGLNWREVRPAGAGAKALFPCRPEVAERGAPPMGLAQCEAGGRSFALAWAQAPGPELVGSALIRMRESLALRLVASGETPQTINVAGMTPSPQALSQTLSGSSWARVAVFARGLRIYQATMLGGKPGREADEAWQAFVGGLVLLD